MYAQEMVVVLGELQKFRRGSVVFVGRERCITSRDSCRWAVRYWLTEIREGFYDYWKHDWRVWFLSFSLCDGCGKCWVKKHKW